MKNIGMVSLVVAAALAVGAAPTVALAQDGDVGIALESTGYGLSIGYPIALAHHLRIQSGNLRTAHNFDAGGNSYTGNINLSNIRLEDDWHLSPNRGFFVSFGAMSNNNTVNANADVTGSSITIGNTSYVAPPGSYVNGNIRWNSFIPYLGIGGAPVHGNGIGWDLGAAFQGPAKVSVSTNVPGTTSADIASTENQIRDSLNGFQVYPVVGVRYVIGF